LFAHSRHSFAIRSVRRSISMAVSRAYNRSSRIHLLAGESHDPNSRTVISHRLSIDGGETWSEPVRIDAGLPSAHSLHRGMDAQIANCRLGDHLIAAWTTAGTDQWGSGPIATARGISAAHLHRDTTCFSVRNFISPSGAIFTIPPVQLTAMSWVFSSQDISGSPGRDRNFLVIQRPSSAFSTI